MALKNVLKPGPLSLSLTATAANTTGPKFVKVNASDNAKFDFCGAGEQAIGVLSGKCEVGELCLIATPPGYLLLELGGTVTAGDKVASDTDGNAVAAAFGAKVNGIAVTGGADGAVASVKILDPLPEAAVGGNIVAFGVATLAAGTKTVTTTVVAAGDKILLTRVTPGGTTGDHSAPVASIVAATSFVINAAVNTDTSTVAWAIVR
jgi:hypothetical protein